MKIPIHLTRFKELLLAVKKFKIYDFSKQTVIKEEIEKFKEGDGLDSDLSNIFQTNEGELFTLLKDGSIRKSIIHIVDISNWREEWGYPRFHIYKCEKIKEMIAAKREQRYKISGKETGCFFIIKKDKECYKSLEICSYCLSIYNRDFKSNKTKQTFEIKDYLDKNFVNEFLSMKIDLDICTVPNKYSNCWHQISIKRKEQEQYRCEECGIDLSKEINRKFLHTHHIDGSKRNNIKGNLKVLCIECHSNKKFHCRIKDSSQYKEFIKKKKMGLLP